MHRRPWLPLLLTLFAVVGLACAPAPAAPSSSSATAAPPPTTGAPASPATPATQASAPAPVQRVTVRAGGLGGTIDRPYFVGLEKGFYDEQGIDLDIQSFSSAADMVPALATGQLDIGHGSTNPGFFNAIASGIPVKVVSNATVLREPTPGIQNSLWIIVAKDLAGQVQSPADLKGLTIAINNRGTMNHGQLEKILRDYGLGLDDIQLESISFPDQMSALANGAIQAAITVEPFITTAQARNIAVPLYDMGRGFPGYPVQYLFYGPDFIKNQPEVGRRLLVAYLKSLRYIEDAFREGGNRDELIQIFVKNTAIKDPALWEKMGLSYNELNGDVNTRAIETDQDFYVRQGFQRTKVDPKDIVDPTFAAYAVQVLGRRD